MYTKVGNGLQVISGDIVNSLVGLENLTYKMSEEFNSERLWTPSHLSMDNAYKTGYMESFSHQASIINSYHGEEKECVHLQDVIIVIVFYKVKVY